MFILIREWSPAYNRVSTGTVVGVLVLESHAFVTNHQSQDWFRQEKSVDAKAVTLTGARRDLDAEQNIYIVVNMSPYRLHINCKEVKIAIIQW